MTGGMWIPSSATLWRRPSAWCTLICRGRPGKGRPLSRGACDLIFRPAQKVKPHRRAAGNKPKEPECPPGGARRVSQKRDDVRRALQQAKEIPWWRSRWTRACPRAKSPHRRQRGRHAGLESSQAHKIAQGGGLRARKILFGRGRGEHDRLDAVYTDTSEGRAGRIRLSLDEIDKVAGKKAGTGGRIARGRCSGTSCPDVERPPCPPSTARFSTDHNLFMRRARSMWPRSPNQIPEMQAASRCG